MLLVVLMVGEEWKYFIIVLNFEMLLNILNI